MSSVFHPLSPVMSSLICAPKSSDKNTYQMLKSVKKGRIQAKEMFNCSMNARE